ncbi:MAG TPA: 4-hydroxythreonine-4-phosphate dehydrogenase PdxA [Bacteroidia bacterium]|nr:4-hydroxythreonine-4-phosphate dehydrogenase PdxA [Bacteroidia bacterium]
MNPVQNTPTQPVATQKPVVIGISQGDINGIGLEVIIKTFSDPAMLEVCTPVLFSSNKTLSSYRKVVPSEHFNYNIMTGIDNIPARKFNLYNCYNEDVALELGKETAIGGKYAVKSLQVACDALEKNKIDALVTAPINKHNTYSEQFPFAGHTSYLDSRFGKGNSLMMLVSGNLRVALLTEHIPVSEVAAAISVEKILKRLNILNKTLREDFSIPKPKIAVLGLNPHAGDGGALGKEEEQIIAPAIKTAQQNNMLVYGPYPADGFFGNMAFQKFDAVLAIYHDQGLIPFKYMAFESGVNFTAGLPIVRTSPDHGTAYDIAGKNKASEASFREAIYVACDLVRTRKEYRKLVSNPLKSYAPSPQDSRDAE